MSRRGFVLSCAAVICAASTAADGAPGYQPIVECVNTTGKVTFGLGKCPQRTDGPFRQVKREPRALPATRDQVLERWDMTDTKLREYEAACGRGHDNTCGFLENLKTTTPASIDLGARELVPKCRQGDKFACEILEMREKETRRSIRMCDHGDQRMCRRLSNSAQ